MAPLLVTAPSARRALIAAVHWPLESPVAARTSLFAAPPATAPIAPRTALSVLWSTAEAERFGDGLLRVCVLGEDVGAEGLAVSAGAACSATRRGASHVLLAMGLSEAEASSCLRFSLCRTSTGEEVDAALALVGDLVGALRTLGPAAG